ncbi:MAG: amidohydrolase family protein [Maricaulaceae bacterium]
MTYKSILMSSAIAAMIATSAAPAHAADKNKDSEKWDVNNPPGKKRDVKIDVTEGTWMSLDVSPDGQTIAFDFLGDIYTLPVTGGTAKNISEGLAWEIQPRFSPDGKRLAFTSDRAGGDNIWTMKIDGSDKQQVTDESFRLINNPTWSPDGQFIAAKKHFTTSRSLGTGEIWLYHTSGGSGVQLTKKPSEAHQKEIGEPIFSPDGRYVYYSANTTPGATFIYAQDSNTQLFEIKRYDMETGEISSMAGGAGGAVRPTPSPDGKHIAYVKRVRAKSQLFIKDLASGQERMVFDHLDQDMQETWAVYGVYPNMDWSPDSKSIYFWAKGQIHRIDIADNNVEHIDFRIRDTRTVMDAPRPKRDVSPDTFTAQMPRYAAVSPDGNATVFESLGKLYVKTNDGTEKRLTSLRDALHEADPAWSRDGRSILFTTWNDRELGTIRRYDMESGQTVLLTREPGHYRRPNLSPNGQILTYEKGTGGYLSAPEWSNEPGIYIQNMNGSAPKRVRKNGSHPHFGTDNKRLFVTASHDKKNALISTNLAGDQERIHASAKLAQSFMMSPNGKTIAFRENYNLFLMPALSGPQNVAAGPKAKALPVTKLSHGGATFPSWSEDGDTVNWTLGSKLYSVKTADAIASDDFKAPKSSQSLARTIETDRPESTIAFINARIVTMASDDGGVIESGTMIVSGSRIKAIGENITLPAGAEIVDLRGKTIIPGFIDAHAHGPQGVGDLTPQQNWSSVAHLALGVTTIFDPSSRAASIFPAAEMQRAGKIIAPRIFSTGEIIYGAKSPGFFAAISNKEDADEHVSRLKNQGAHGVKNYNQPRRDQRQQVVHAARENDIITVAEGGSLFHMDMSMVTDGNTSIEHNLPQSALYDDVIQLYSQTNVAYTPTLVVTYGGVRGEDYYYQNSDVWKHPILSKHVPPTVLQARAVRRQMAPVEDYSDAVSAATAKQLADAGVLVSIGAHGQREGLASHWEIWSFARGGMSPVEALRTATTAPAKHLGFDEDIGSLEAGKLADMIILSANPLEDIHNTDKIEKVMIGGRLYEASTMNEVLSGNRKRAAYWWED